MVRDGRSRPKAIACADNPRPARRTRWRLLSPSDREQAGPTMTSSTDPTPRGMTVLGAAAGSGKTGVSIGVLRHLRLRGIPRQPFKAAAVVAPDDPAYAAVEPWQRGVLHNCQAAGLAIHWW